MKLRFSKYWIAWAVISKYLGLKLWMYFGDIELMVDLYSNTEWGHLEIRLLFWGVSLQWDRKGIY